MTIKQTLLTQGNAKIVKGEELGYLTKGIHLAPADISGMKSAVGVQKVAQWLVLTRQVVGVCKTRKTHA